MFGIHSEAHEPCWRRSTHEHISAGRVSARATEQVRNRPGPTVFSQRLPGMCWPHVGLTAAP
jgi:hypothetical protein